MSDNLRARDLEILIESAKCGNIDPLKFCLELEKMGIAGAGALPYLIAAYEMKFEDAKETLIKYHHGSVDAWAAETEELLDELSQKDLGLETRHGQ